MKYIVAQISHMRHTVLVLLTSLRVVMGLLLAVYCFSYSFARGKYITELERDFVLMFSLDDDLSFCERVYSYVY